MGVYRYGVCKTQHFGSGGTQGESSDGWGVGNGVIPLPAVWWEVQGRSWQDGYERLSSDLPVRTLTEVGINIRLKIWSSVVSRVNSSMRWRLRQQKGFGKRRLLEDCSRSWNRKRRGGVMRTQLLQLVPVKVAKDTCYIQMSGNEWEEWWTLDSWASPRNYCKWDSSSSSNVELNLTLGRKLQLFNYY